MWEGVGVKITSGCGTELGECRGHLLKGGKCVVWGEVCFVLGFFEKRQVSLGQVQFAILTRHISGDVRLAL